MADADSSPYKGGDSTTVLLGLYLLLLAFFTMLNAVSQVAEARRQEVIDSVQGTFGPPAPASPVPMVVVPIDIDTGALADALQGELEQAIKWALPIAQVEANASGSELKINAPLAAFFEDQDDRVRAASRRFLVRMASAIGEAEASGRIDLEVAVGGLTPRGTDAVLAVSRAGSLARALVDAGLAASKLAIGIERHSDQVEIRFLPPGAQAAAVTFDHLAQRP